MTFPRPAAHIVLAFGLGALTVPVVDALTRGFLYWNRFVSRSSA